MNGDPVNPVYTILQEAQSLIRQGATPTEVLQSIETALDRLLEIEQRISKIERNLAAQQAILDERLLRIETNRVFTIWNTIATKRRNFVRTARSALARSPVHGLVHSPSPAEQRKFNAAYTKWLNGQQAERAHTTSETWPRQPAISLVLAIRHGRGLAETLQSLQNQVYLNWELCLAVDEKFEPQALPLIREFEAKYRVPHRIAANASDTATALNAAADLATGEYLSFLDEESTLSPLALFSIAEALHSTDFDLLYTDEDTLDAEGSHIRPVFKPDWSPDLLTSCMYMGSLLTVRREVFRQCGGLRPEYDGAHLHDLALRLADAPIKVHHIPRVLYHSSTVGRTAADLENRVAARAIEDAISRRERVLSTCVPGPQHSTFLVRRKRPAEVTTVVICSKSAELCGRCLSSLRATAAETIARIIVVAHEESGPDPQLRQVIQQAAATAVSFSGRFNFSAMNNLGVELATTQNLLFLNDDVEATSPGWAEMLNEQLSREEIGIAGAVLWYPSGTLQHAGIVVGIGDGVGHAGRFGSSNELWPWLLVSRNVSAVTGACLAIRKELFHQLGGFDTAFPNNYNDVDLCFRTRALGLKVVCVPVPGLTHHECQSRRGIVRFEERYGFYKKWADILSRPDPYYSTSLAPAEEIALNLDHDPWHRPLLEPKTAFGQ